MQLLLLVDRVLGTELVQWELARRQRDVERLKGDIESINQELAALADELALYRLLFCLVALMARQQRMGPEAWRRFAPHRDGEEALLDSVIENLVKPRLATVDVEADGDQGYVYLLIPDWKAIRARLRDAPVAPELQAWLEEQG